MLKPPVYGILLWQPKPTKRGVTANENRVSFWSNKRTVIDCGEGDKTL